jgi:PAS domain S-box-containing protein
MTHHAKPLTPTGESSDLFRLVFEATPHALVLAGAQGEIVLVNARAEGLFGYTRAGMIGRPIEMLMPERFRAAHRDHRAEYAKHAGERLLGRGRNLTALRKDGSEIPVEIGLNPIETPEGLLTLTTIFDITERLRIETAMSASELRYRRLFESAKDGILILDAGTGMVVDVNPFLEKLLGFSHEQFLGKAIWELGFFKDVVANADKFAELRDKEYVRYEDLPLETSDGRRIDVEFVSNVYLVDGGRVIQCNIRDITGRKRSEDRFRRLVESNAQGVIFWNTSGAITGANDAFLCLMGYTREDLDGGLMNWIAMTPPEFAERDRHCLEEIAAKGVCPEWHSLKGEIG